MEAEAAGNGAEDNGNRPAPRSGFPAPGARRGHRVKQRTPSGRVKARSWAPPRRRFAPAIPPLALAATGDWRWNGPRASGCAKRRYAPGPGAAPVRGDGARDPCTRWSIAGLLTHLRRPLARLVFQRSSRRIDSAFARASHWDSAVTSITSSADLPKVEKMWFLELLTDSKISR